jgi:L-asparagine oxygenase
MWSLIKNLPIEHAEKFLFLFANHLGRPMAYLGERNGNVIHEIKPLTEFKHKPTSLGFGKNLGLHTEMAFHDIRPNYVLLFCIRNRWTRTFMLSHDKILSKLNPLTRRILMEPNFMIHPPLSYTHEYKSQWRPILKKGELTMANHCRIEFLDDNSKLAYDNLRKISEDQKEEIILESGDLLIMNNRKIVHGRSSRVSPDRLLKRMYVY